MSFKTFAVLFLVCFLTFEITQCNEIEDKSILDEVVKKAKELFAKIQTQVKKLIDDALKTLEDLKNKVTDIASAAIVKATEQIEAVINKAKSAIDEIIKQAEEAGTDIKECLGNVEKLNELPKQFIENEINCVLSEVATAQKIIADAINTVSDIYQTVSEFPSRLDNCLQSPTALKCVNGLIADMLKLQVSAPVDIAKEVAAAITFVTGLQTRVEACAVAQVAQAGKDSLQIVDDMRKCVTDHIIP